MKIFDCFMFYDEEMLLDIRLNTLDKFIDKFIIVESMFTHSGKKRELIFDIKKFQKFTILFILPIKKGSTQFLIHR